MAYDAIGAAAAVEALKITAANNQSNVRPQQGGRPQGGFQATADASQARPFTDVSSGAQASPNVGGRPSGGKPQGRPQNAADDEKDEGPADKLHAPTGGGGLQDKIVGFSAESVVDIVLNLADRP